MIIQTFQCTALNIFKEGESDCIHFKVVSCSEQNGNVTDSKFTEFAVTKKKDPKNKKNTDICQELFS